MVCLRNISVDTLHKGDTNGDDDDDDDDDDDNNNMPVSVTARSKASGCGHSPAEIVGSNSTGDMDACL